MKQAKNLIPPLSSQSQSGMTLIEVMIAVAISSVVILASLSIGNMTTNLQNQNNFSFQADMIRRNIVTLLLSDSSWQKTLAADPSMACISSGTCNPPFSAKPIKLIYDGSNVLAYNVDDTTGHGFNSDGTACTSTSPVCTLTYTVTWLPLCTAACSSPQVQIDITAHYTAPTGAAANVRGSVPFNEANYSARIYR
jgi:prepilin-type N-terminal cleavage/methylation domain-containing protein